MPKIVDHRERRAHIADAVLDIIANVGVSAVTIRDVATAGGWSTGVIHHYVGGRDDLLLLAFRRASWLSGQRLESITKQAELDAFSTLKAVLKSTLPLDHDSLAMSRIYLFFYAAAAADKNFGADMRRYIESWQTAVESCVRDLLAEQGIPTEVAREVGNFLIAVTDGFAIHATIGSVLNEDVHLRPEPEVGTWIRSALHLAENLVHR